MSSFIDIDGKRYTWRDTLQLRREQKKAHAKVQQPALFELKEDRQPVAGRYSHADRVRFSWRPLRFRHPVPLSPDPHHGGAESE